MKQFVLIVGDDFDYSTNSVIDWLSTFKVKSVRLSETNVIIGVNLSMTESGSSIVLKTHQGSINFDDIISFWFRRGRIKSNFIDVECEIKTDNIYKGTRDHLFFEENKTLIEYVVFELSKLTKIGNYYQPNANKLISLQVASSLNIKTPNTFISNEKDVLKNLFNHNKSMITKGIQDVLSFAVDEKSYAYCTNIVHKEDIQEMSNHFFPSLLQPNIPKLYELRIFYLLGEFYSMAIFSQNDDKTKVDFRNYNCEKPNRTVPYLLPKDIEQKLDLFMRNMNLDTGSIDMIVTPEFEYVFLEVNPVGQYGMTSYPCNYYLDEIIAKHLANEK